MVPRFVFALLTIRAMARRMSLGKNNGQLLLVLLLLLLLLLLL